MSTNDIAADQLREGALAALGVTLITGDPIMGAIFGVGHGLQMGAAYDAAVEEIERLEAAHARAISVPRS